MLREGRRREGGRRDRLRLQHGAGAAEERARRRGLLLRLNAMTSRPIVLASLVLALALLGDSLLYAVLPLHAAAFGISLAWVGVLLSANRIVRLFVYPFLPRLAAAGLRRFTIAAASVGALSTLAFAFASGAWVLLASRLAWGVAFGSLSLSVLAYATSSVEGAGTRVGLSYSLRELGPVLSLTAGTAIAAAWGARPALAILGMLSLAGIYVATHLPDAKPAAERTPSLRSPVRDEWLSATAGFVTDGIFPATIALLLSASTGVRGAVIAAGLLLVVKRAAVILLAPVSGFAADRFGARTVTLTGVAIAAAGAIVIASDAVLAGAIVLSCGAAVTTTSIPLAAGAEGRERVGALARLAMARDAGAAAGPLVAIPLFEVVGGSVLYLGAAAMLLVFAGTARRLTLSADTP